MIIYRATLDVPRELAWFAAKLLLAERRKGPWTRDFSHVIPDGKIISCKIGDIARAAPVLTHFEHGYGTRISLGSLHCLDRVPIWRFCAETMVLAAALGIGRPAGRSAGISRLLWVGAGLSGDARFHHASERYRFEDVRCQAAASFGLSRVEAIHGMDYAQMTSLSDRPGGLYAMRAVATASWPDRLGER